jgi:hypothetical protein
MSRIVLSSLSFAALAALLAGGGCVPNTSFKGAAHFPGGAQACFSACQSQNMEMSGFVMSGEFASSCVCRPRPVAPPADATPAPAPADERSQAEVDTADVAASTGVVLQQRAAEQRRRQRMLHSH